MVAGCRLDTWQRWHNIGSLATSIRSLFVPCGSWQLTQFSRPAACSHRNGPRFSAWHVAQASLIELPSRSILTFCDPCGLWHVVHSSLPSRTGMCDDRCTLATSFVWHCTQVSVTVSFFSWASVDFGSCTLWQVVQDMLRESCLLPAQLLCSLRAWHVVQVSPT